mmetsp:Transcript_9466/g.38707  ORF Transcript_9466/g.38707 Transcript_9466/m.38707 type:complete len:273 (+) Transcript_9466:151-969(+)
MAWELLFSRALQWQWVVDHWPWGDQALFIVGGAIVHTGVFTALNLFFFALHKFKLFERYKIPRKSYPSTELVKKCIKNLLVSHLLVQWVSFYFVGQMWASVAGSEGIHSAPPPWTAVIWQLVVMMTINDTLFYWAHRLLHHRLLYAKIHKRHHEFKSTIGIAAEYAHPIEGIVANAIPTLTGPILLGVHLWTFWLYVTLRLWETVESHSGYAFPWSIWSLFDFQGGAEMHDYHHSHNVGNYGGAAFSFWDSLMGTDRHYREYKAAQEAAKAK